MPPQFFAMLKAELSVVFRRGTGVAVLIVGALVGVVSILGLQFLKGQMDMTANGQPVAQLIQYSGGDAAGLALRGRNFFVLPMFLLLATGNALATEREDHTLRELLVRPVPRWSVVMVKFLALLALSVASLVMSLLPSFGGGLALYGELGPAQDVLLGYAASALSDAGLIALGLLAGTLVRGAGGVVVSVIGLLMVDLALRAFLWVLDKVGVVGAAALGDYLPGKALAAWEDWSTGFLWQPFASLALLISVGLGLTIFRVQRMDVP